MKFEHLNIPNHWQNDFTRYPEGYTILEALFNWVRQVNDMSDNLNNINNRLDEFIQQFDKSLQGTVKELLEKWKASGLFNDLIEGAIFGEFKERLDDLAYNPISFSSLSVAIATAKKDKRALDLGQETYAITENIPDIHNVELRGTTGAIKRENVLFHANPTKENVNTLYVDSKTGNDNYDGLSPSYAFRTVQKALTTLYHYASPTLKGQWIISLGAGTYEGARMDEEIISECPIIIKGIEVDGHPNVPRTIITNGAGASAVGLLFKGRFTIDVRDIKFIGYNGTTSSAGISIAYGADLVTTNVHTDGCYWGISSQKSNFHVPDGIHERNGYLPNQPSGNGAAFRSLMLNRHHIGIQNAGNRTKTPIIRNNACGLNAQEFSTGHVDWCTIEGNDDGVRLNISCRANVDGCLFKNNVRGVRRLANSHVYIATTTQFEGNQCNTTGLSGSEMTSMNLVDGMDIAYSTDERILKTAYVNKDINNTTAENAFFITLKAGFWKSIVNTVTPIKKIEITMYGSIKNSSVPNTKQLVTRLGGQLAALSIAASENGTFKATSSIYFVDENTQFMFMEGGVHLGTNRQSAKTLNIDMSQDQLLQVQGQTANVEDTVHFDVVEIKVAGI